MEQTISIKCVDFECSPDKYPDEEDHIKNKTFFLAVIIRTCECTEVHSKLFGRRFTLKYCPSGRPADRLTGVIVITGTNVYTKCICV